MTIDAQTSLRAVVRHPIGGRLLTAQAISELGDFIGLAALLLLAYHATGSVLGSAAVFAARSLPALLVATVFSGWLDRPVRRTTLIALSVAGAPIISLPLVLPRAWTALVAAGLLGAIRAAYRSTSVALIAEAVPRDVRLRLFGASSLINQSSQVIGLIAGVSVAQTVGVRTAFLIDALSFLIAAAVLTQLPRPPQKERPHRAPAMAGIRIVMSHPILRVLAILAWTAVLGSGFPEAVSPKISHGGWLPLVMAASPLGAALFSLPATRGQWLDRPRNQVLLASAEAALLVLAGIVLIAHGPQWAIFGTNVAAGAAAGWIIGTQATFARLAPAERMGQVEATMVAANIVLNGVGVLVLGAVTYWIDAAAAYVLVGALGLLAAAVALGYMADPPIDRAPGRHRVDVG